MSPPTGESGVTNSIETTAGPLNPSASTTPGTETDKLRAADPWATREWVAWTFERGDELYGSGWPPENHGIDSI